LAGMKWNDFRKAQCSDMAAPTATAPTPAPSSPAPVTATKPAPVAPTPTIAARPAPLPTGNASFPTAISPKYASESAGKARMHTCLDQYKLNKTTGANGGLNWIQKGGGYYSECNKRLKSLNTLSGTRNPIDERTRFLRGASVARDWLRALTNLPLKLASVYS
jgi:hypothetical protein